MCLLVAALEQLHLKRSPLINLLILSTNLGVDEDSDAGAVLLHLVEVALDGLLAIFILPLLGVLGESLLLALVPAS